jgi:hypothetical protein
MLIVCLLDLLGICSFFDCIIDILLPILVILIVILAIIATSFVWHSLYLLI